MLIMKLKPVSLSALQKLDIGESVLFPLPAKAISASACRAGVLVTQSKRMLIDPKTYEVIPVILVTRLASIDSAE